MMTIHDEDGDPVEWGPLVFHIRRFRQWCGDYGLSQRELAELADVSPHQVRLYENSRALPQPILFLLAISLALNIPMESLFDRHTTERLRKKIDERRRQLERGQAEQEMMDLPCRSREE